MTTFDERERAFEAKFAHDEEFRYLVRGRRDRLFAVWAARRMNLSDDDTTALTAAVLHVSDGEGHDERLIHHVADALAVRGKAVNEADLHAALKECATEAKAQLMDGLPAD